MNGQHCAPAAVSVGDDPGAIEQEAEWARQLVSMVSGEGKKAVASAANGQDSS
jgi:hypothetical protein